MKRAINEEISQVNHPIGQRKLTTQGDKDMHLFKGPEKMRERSGFLKYGPTVPATKIPTVFLKNAESWGPRQT